MNRYIKFYSIFLLVSWLLNGCGQSQTTGEAKASDSTAAPGFTIDSASFGSVNGKAVTRYTLTNSSGMSVSLLNYGGTVQQIMVPDRRGIPGDVVLGFDSLTGYLQQNNPYIGALIGRYGNRIGGAAFTLNGQRYRLYANDHGNSLHGGLRGFNKVVWTAASGKTDTSAFLALHYLSPDGEEGYPGNLQVTVIYTLTGSNALHIEYQATTDKACPVNLTNHSYFNLSALKDSTILNEEIRIAADRYTAVNPGLIPTGKLPAVAGTPMDFIHAHKIGDHLAEVKGGYDHNYVLNTVGNLNLPAVELYDSPSGRLMQVYTTEPGIQFYTGNFLDGKLTGKNGKHYPQHGALCLEAQHFPDSPNQPSFPTTILKPGEKYYQHTIYKFSSK